jgi:hypothetical protein
MVGETPATGGWTPEVALERSEEGLLVRVSHRHRYQIDFILAASQEAIRSVHAQHLDILSRRYAQDAAKTHAEVIVSQSALTLDGVNIQIRIEEMLLDVLQHAHQLFWQRVQIFSQLLPEGSQLHPDLFVFDLQIRHRSLEAQMHEVYSCG